MSNKNQFDNIALKKIRDPKFYLENFTKIKGKTTGGLIQFKLREAQIDILNTMRKYNRVIILKARQIGFSTSTVGYFYHRTIMNPGTTTALIGYNAALTSELLEKVKTFWKSTPAVLRPTIQYNSKSEISFPSINSKILILPSTVNVGRGYTLNNVHITELAFWDDPEDKMMALEAAVPIDGKIVIESTPNGQGNLYHEMWMSDDNGYAKKEYGWWWGYSEDEIDIIRRRLNDPRKFAQEYGCDFISSGRSVFDQNAIKRQRVNVLKVGDEVKLEDGSKHIVGVKGGLRTYKPPTSDGIYVCGVDVAEGVAGGDYSVATIWNRKTGEEVAMYRGYFPPDVFGKKLDEWGRLYNNALMVVEINNHGLTTLTVLRQACYPTLYFRPAKFESIATPISDKFGWKTTKMTRELLIDELGQGVREDDLTIHSKEILDEMTIMIYDENANMMVPDKFHDDCIFSAGIAFQGFKAMYSIIPTQINHEKFLPINFSY